MGNNLDRPQRACKRSAESAQSNSSEWGLYPKLDNGDWVRATYDDRQVGADRLSGGDLESYLIESALTDAQRDALREDLASDA